MYCISYVIKKGDNLYSLSRQFGVPLSSIMDANPLVNVYNLQVGEVICIPVSIPQNNYSSFTTYQVVEGDTLQTVLDMNRINLADLMQINSPMNIQLLPGTILQVPVITEEDNEDM